MKKVLSKTLILSVMLVFLMSLTGCDENETLNYEFDRDSMQSYTQDIISKYKSTSAEEQDYFLSEGSELERTAVSGFLAAESTDHVGDFIDFVEGDDAVEFSNGTDGKVICSQICNYDKRDVKVSISYKQNKAYELDKQRAYDNLVRTATQYGMDVTAYVTQAFGQYKEFDMTSMDKFLDSYLALTNDERPFTPVDCEVSAVYSKKELIGQAGKNTAIGMGVVFAVLIFISFIISLLKYLPLLFDADIRRAKAEEKAAHEAAKKRAEEMIIASKSSESPKQGEAKDDKKPETTAVAAPAKNTSDKNLMDDSELVAVITAAVYAAAGERRGPAYTASNDKLIVRSIRRSR